MEVEDRQNEGNSRRNVLQEAQNVERQQVSPKGEQDQRNGRRYPCKDQEPSRRCPTMVEVGQSKVINKEKVNQGQRCDEESFQGNGRKWIDVKLLLQGPIDGKGQSQANGNPRKDTMQDSQHENAKGRNGDGKPLSRNQILLKDHHAQENAEQRIDVVTYAGIHNVIVGHGPNVDEPVTRNQKRRPN